MSTARKIPLACGRGAVELEIAPDIEHKVTVWRTAELEPLADPRAAVEQSLASPLGVASLDQLAAKSRTACVVISDITRPAPNKLLLPPILDTLRVAGLGREDICILVATGMHGPTQGEALTELVGPEIAAGYDIVNHDCRADAELHEIMRIEGWPIRVNRRYLEADLKILTGLIEPHPFAGYSGGGKSVLPGIASFDSMRFMHSFALVDDPRVAAANLEDNPFQDYVRKAARTAGADLVLNVVQDMHKHLVGVFAGSLDEVFDKGCELAARMSVIQPDSPADLVVTTSGGYPLDATLYQSSKGLVTAGQVLEPGGRVLWLNGCERGLGGEAFVNMVRAHPDYDSFSRHYARPENFTIDQWGAQAYFMAKRRAHEVWLYSPGLGRDQHWGFGLERAHDLKQCFDNLAREAQRVYVLPEGPYMACRVG